jgi:archaellum component FlaG (FlaF/FlaG flagellin family)
LQNTKLRDSTAASIPYIAEDGYFDNRPPISPATIYVDPNKIVDPLLTPSNQFDVNITIANATDVYSFEFKLGFDPTILNVVDVTLGDFFPPSVTPTVTIDNIGGYVSVLASLTPPEPPKSGDGTLATIRFHVEDLGKSVLDLYDTQLADEAGSPLPHSALDGFFDNILLAKLYVDPSSIIDPTLTPPKIFTIDIVIDDVENLYGYEFKLGYDTNMLTAIGILIHPVLNETSFNASMSVDDGTGLIWVKVQYYPPATPITTYTPASLVTLTFKVDAIGSSVLDLYDTSLTDSGGLPIDHEPIDGYVQTLIRDVAIVNVVASHTWAYEGTLVNVSVTAKNLGNVSETFDVSAYYDDNLIGTVPVMNLPSNSETTIVFTWNTSDVVEGYYTLKATASYVPYEFNLTNNVYVDGTINIKSLIHDVAIIHVAASATEVYQGKPVNITVVAKNVGNVTETFDVTAYYDNNTIGTQLVTDLAPDTEITLMFIWDTTDVQPCNNYTISAEASTVPFEVNTANNVLTDGYVKVKFMGDINGDGVVDLDDITIIGLAFGSYPGHPRWNPDADLDEDGIVDITDVVLAAINFGKTC